MEILPFKWQSKLKLPWVAFFIFLFLAGVALSIPSIVSNLLEKAATTTGIIFEYETWYRSFQMLGLQLILFSLLGLYLGFRFISKSEKANTHLAELKRVLLIFIGLFVSIYIFILARHAYFSKRG